MAEYLPHKNGPTRLKPRHKEADCRDFCQIKARPNLTNIVLNCESSLKQTVPLTTQSSIGHKCKDNDLLIILVTQVLVTGVGSILPDDCLLFSTKTLDEILKRRVGPWETFFQKIHSTMDEYRKTSNIRRTLVGNKIVDHSDVVGASPVGAVPTTSSLST